MTENFKTIKQAELEINPPKEKCKENCKCTTLTKQSIYNQIRLLVNTEKDDLVLLSKIKKLFS